MDVRRIARMYYKRKDIQDALISYSANREIVPRYSDSFGKRPDILEYPNDIANLADKGVTSFHCSEELWRNPMDLKTALNPEQLNDIRIGWDLMLDIDSDFIEYSKIAAQLVIDALRFNNIQNIGVKFSGRGGWHIGLGFQAFPEEVKGIKIKDLFPQGPRWIASYLQEMIAKSLSERILAVTDLNEIAARLGKPIDSFHEKGKFNPFSLVHIDTVLIASRHLYRMPYSINEKSGLASIVIKPEQIMQFNLGWARPDRVFPKPYLPEPEKGEAKELMVQAIDWQKTQIPREGLKKPDGNSPKKEFIIKDVSPDTYPPCIIKILQGMKDDGKKRALFILINFFRSINISDEDIKKKVEEWNQKNNPPLREGYILTQLSWHLKQKSMLPSNCDKPQYKDIGVCFPDFFCSKIKNPVNYTLVKKRSLYPQNTDFKKSKSRKKTTFQKGGVEIGVSKGYYAGKSRGFYKV